MERDVIAVAPTMPAHELRGILRDNRISGTPVLENEELVGVVSIEDFIGWLADGAPDCTVAERMTTNVVTVFEDEPLVMAVNKLDRFGVGRLPVVCRESGRMSGVITKGDIIEGMLKKLDVDFRQAETRSGRSRHIFEDVVAESSALTLEYSVPSKDLSKAGASATALKTTLMRLGFSPEIARRAVIAAYEAEMNLIFYATGGRIAVTIEPEKIRLEIEDSGPGIPDVDKALEPGYSTSPDWVRELGFGAGMGLVNIRECADDMSIESTVGEGTRIVVDILLEAKHAAQ